MASIQATSRSSGEPRPLEEGALYTVQERLSTFTDPNCHWPFDSGSCTPLKMAEAGFYFCGTDSTPDWVRCAVCHHDLEGWEETDMPREEHQTHQPNCPYLKIKDPYNITFGDVIDLEKKAFEFFVEREAEKLGQDLQLVIDQFKEILVKEGSKS